MRVDTASNEETFASITSLRIAGIVALLQCGAGHEGQDLRISSPAKREPSAAAETRVRFHRFRAEKRFVQEIGLDRLLAERSPWLARLQGDAQHSHA